MKCLACSSTDVLPPRAQELPPPRALDFGSRRTSVWRPSIAVCRSCGFGWQSPAPSAELLTRTYEELHDDLYVEETENRLRAFRRSERLIERYAGRPAGSLLDVGCSAGLFLEIARDAGWDVWGIEPSAWLSSLARQRIGDHVVTGTFEASPFESSRFAAITMWDVLEHVADPSVFLARARALLRANGLLAINVPCRDSIIARVLRSRWPLLLPEHLTYFTRPSLRALLAMNGFEILGFHLHPVFFSLGYVVHRLAQHGLTVPFVGKSIGELTVPLLMGELTVIARTK
jgi:SAM-dependent methyltransferase